MHDRRAARRTRRAIAAALLLGALGVACEDESVGLREAFPVEPYGVAACDTRDGRLNGGRELRLHANPGLDATGTARALQRYYRRWGITFQSSRAPNVTDTGFVEDLDDAALNATLRRDFPDVDLSDAGLTALARRDPTLFNRIVKTVLNFQFRGAREFLDKHGHDGPRVTHIVVLKSLFTPLSPQDQREKVLGIALSPFLFQELKRTGMDQAGAFQLLDFPPDFSPVVFISETNVKGLESRAGAVHRDLVVSHEFGHSAGLVHRSDATNLMNPTTNGRETCSIGLAADQVGVMQKGLGFSGPLLARELTGSAETAERPAIPPSLLAGVIRGDDDAREALLAPLQHAH